MDKLPYITLTPALIEKRDEANELYGKPCEVCGVWVISIFDALCYEHWRERALAERRHNWRFG